MVISGVRSVAYFILNICYIIVAQHEVNEFIDQTNLFIKDYRENGPDSVGTNLELGLQKLKVSKTLICINLTVIYDTTI